MSILRPYPGEIFYSWVVRMYALYTRGEESWLREMFVIGRKNWLFSNAQKLAQICPLSF
ncbi:MAG: hypothetical protein RR289_01395 [Niameybacter sp.]